jgi:hypothetical protein
MTAFFTNKHHKKRIPIYVNPNRSTSLPNKERRLAL